MLVSGACFYILWSKTQLPSTFLTPDSEIMPRSTSPTSGYSVPVGPIDNVALSHEVIVMAEAPVVIHHDKIRGGVDSGEPAENSVVGCGCELLSFPVSAGHVKWVGHHQLTSMQIGTEHERVALHPVDDSPSFWGYLWQGKRGGGGLR